MNVAGYKSSPDDPKPSRPYSVFVFNAGSCGGCELEILSLFQHSHQHEGFWCNFVSQPESADLILLFGSLNRESYEVLKKFLPRFGSNFRRLAVGACAISGEVFQSAPRTGTMMEGSRAIPGSCAQVPSALDLPYKNLIQEFSPALYVAGCPPAPEDIWQGLQYLAIGTQPSAEASRIEFNSELCLGCGLCQQICPARAIKIRSSQWSAASGSQCGPGVLPAIPQNAEIPARPSCLVEFNQGACVFCSLCEQLCPTGCIRLRDPKPLIQAHREEFLVRSSLPLVRCPTCQRWVVAMPEGFVRQVFGSLPDRTWLELCPACRQSAAARYLKTAAEGFHHLHKLTTKGGV